MDLRPWLHDAFEIGRHPLRPNGRSISQDGSLVREDLSFLNAAGEAVPGILLRPSHAEVPSPAILYIHAHGGRYAIGSSELTDGRPALQSPLGPVLASLGYRGAVNRSALLRCPRHRIRERRCKGPAVVWTKPRRSDARRTVFRSRLDHLERRRRPLSHWGLRAVDGSDIRHLARCRRPATRLRRPRMLLCGLRDARGDWST